MTEIITDYLDAKQLADRLTALELRSTSELARLEQERDEAREKVEQQRKEIVRLNGATSHAGGTPLKIALRERDEWAAMCGRYKQERDEAREEAAHWKSEWEIVEARLCGWKHPSDNGIIFEHEVIPVLRKERDDAREKAERYRLEANAIMMQRDEARDAILGWENKWKCAVDMAARAELERDEALKCAKEYYVEFIRNASSDNKVSKPNPLNPFYKY